VRPGRAPWTGYLPAVGFVGGFLFLWEAAVRGLGVSWLLLPPPTVIAGDVLGRLPFYLDHALATVQAVGAGLGLALILASVLATLMAEVPWVGQALYPLLIASQAVPAIAIAPLLVVYFGYGILPRALVATLICFFPLTVNISRGLMAVDQDAVTLMRALGAGRASVFFRVRVPHAVPYIFAGLKICVVLATVGAVVGEWVGALEGLGYLILIASEQLNARLTFGAISVTCAVGLLLYGLTNALERWLAPWK
jgi:ABC-type nitrate/sulfonate/bicarbonate transport system permease component